MQKNRNALVAGTFIIASIAAVFGVVYAVRSTSFESMQIRTVSFALKDNISGLRVGDEVRIGGFKVGEVRDIEIVPADDARLKNRPVPVSDQAALLVTFALPTRYNLRTDTHIGIESTVTEKTVLNISYLGTGKVLADNATLIGSPSALYAAIDEIASLAPRMKSIVGQIDTVTLPTVNRTLGGFETKTMPKVNDAIDKAGNTAQAATDLVKAIQGKLDPIIGKYNEVADSARSAMTNAADLMGDRKTDTDLRGTLKNLRSITATLDKQLPELAAEVKNTIVTARARIEEVKGIIADAKGVSASINRLIGGNEGRLAAMVKHMDGTTVNLEEFSAEVRARPWRLLYSPKKSEVSNLVVFDAAREFARGANDLNDAAQALRDALRTKDAKPEDVKKLMDEVDARFKKFSSVEEKLWDAVKK